MSRQPSKKPRPKPGPDVVEVSKLSAALGQFESAILLWFNEGDPVSILVLASNAEDCLNAIGSKVGKPSAYQVWLNARPKSFRERSKYIQDYAKHGFKDLEETALLGLRVAEALMYFCGRSYRELFGPPTPLMFAFDIRVALENPTLVSTAAEEVIANLGEINESHGVITRQQFLEENLPAFEIMAANGLLHSGDPPEMTKPSEKP